MLRYLHIPDQGGWVDHGFSTGPSSLSQWGSLALDVTDGRFFFSFHPTLFSFLKGSWISAVCPGWIPLFSQTLDAPEGRRTEEWPAQAVSVGARGAVVPKLGCTQCTPKPARCSCICLWNAEIPGMEPHAPSTSQPSQILLIPPQPEPNTFYAPPVMTYELLQESGAQECLRASDAFYSCVGVILFYYLIK